MDVNQLIDGIGAAASATKPTQEYCLFFIDWWPMCMTKSEWSGWMQAIGAVIALIIAILLPYFQSLVMRLKLFKSAKSCLTYHATVTTALHVNMLRNPDKQVALKSVVELVKVLQIMYSEINIKELPVQSLPVWLSSMTNANHLQTMISEENSMSDNQLLDISSRLHRHSVDLMESFALHESKTYKLLKWMI